MDSCVFVVVSTSSSCAVWNGVLDVVLETNAGERAPSFLLAKAETPVVDDDEIRESKARLQKFILI